MDGQIPPPPDGYTLQDAQASAIPPPPPGYQLQTTTPESTPQSLPDVVVHPSTFQQVNQFGNDLGDSFVHNLAKLPVGVGQLAAHGLKSLTDAGASTAAPGSIGSRLAGYVDNKVGAMDNAIASNEQAYQKAVPTNAASVTGAVLGNVLPYAVGGEVAAAPKAATTLGRIVSGVSTGGAIGAAQPVVTTGPNSPSFAQQKAEQIGVGGMVGGAIPAIGGIARTVIGQASPEVQALAKQAAAYGIDLNGPQISKSIPLKVANSTTAPIPFSGSTAAIEKQQGQFNNAVAQTIGLPNGTTKITPDVFAQAKKIIGQGYDDLAARNNLTINPPLVSRIQAILGEAHTDGDPDAARAISNLTTEIIGKASQNGSRLTGQQFQSIDSRLGRLASNPTGGDKAHYAGELQDALRESMEAGMSPSDAARSAELRSQWRNALNLTQMLTSGDGNVAPSRLLSAVANNKVGKTQLATGNRGDLGTLAQIGKQFMTDPVANSQTALRTMGMNTLKGLGALGAGSVVGVPAATALPAAGATVVAARLIQSGLRSRALYNAIANLPKAQQTPVRDAVSALLSSKSAQNINQLNMTPTPSANNISAQVNL